MDSFINKKNMEIIAERIIILSKKLELFRSSGEEFLQHRDNLESYVRIQFLLGEPCWGKFSPANNHN